MVQIFLTVNPKAGRFYPTFFGEEPIKAAEPLPEQLEYDCRLQKTNLGEFYLCIPKPLEIKSDNQAPEFPTYEEGIVSIDPGVRTFATAYTPSGYVAEWGKRDEKRLFRLCLHVDKLQSEWSLPTTRHRKRYRLKRAAKRVRRKIKNLVDELHKKLCNWIVNGFNLVLLPKFNAHEMSEKRKVRLKLSFF